jgi:hypothetical protein
VKVLDSYLLFKNEIAEKMDSLNWNARCGSAVVEKQLKYAPPSIKED